MATGQARSVAAYALRRIAESVAVVVLAYLFAFTVLTVLPGDPISTQLRNPEAAYSEDDIARLLSYYGLDQPLQVQLLHSIGHLARGDLGLSLQTSRPVGAMIAEAIPPTLALAALAFVLAVVGAFVIALGVQFLPPALGGGILRLLPSFCLSLPYFFVALMIMQVFSFKLGWFQVITDEGLKGLVLPAVTLAIPTTAPIAQVLISSLDRVREQDFVTVAHARGTRERVVFTRHMLRPASLPALTLLGLTAGELLSGSVITEAIFGRQGMGALIEQSVSHQDVPVLQAVVIVIVVLYTVINLIVDLAYPLLDPRVRTFGSPQKVSA